MSQGFDDGDTLIKRLKRYASVGSAATMVAGRYVLQSKVLGGEGEPPGNTHGDTTKDRRRQGDDLAALLYGYLSTLRGPLMKVPQLLATIPDFLPPVYQEKFMMLQSNVPPMGALFVRRRMTTELGHDWQRHFAHFDRQARFGASLGQVHWGQLVDGHAVACKLQYPDMSSAVTADLSQLQAMVRLYHMVSGALRVDELLDELKDHLPQELDYRQEAANIGIFRDIFRDDPTIHVPRVVDDLTTQRLLTMTWLQGDSVWAYVDASQDLRNAIAHRLFYAWYKPLYHHGILHGDPHAGNYTVVPGADAAGADVAINLLDFGCIRRFEPSVVEGVIELYRALLTDDEERAHHAYTLWGFTHLSKDLMATLNDWARFLYGPLLVDRVVDLPTEFPSQAGQKIAGAILEKLAKNGGVQPPRVFLFLDRAAVGMGSVFLRLRAKLNWHQRIEALIASRSALNGGN